jgi:hypothetical protein
MTTNRGRLPRAPCMSSRAMIGADHLPQRAIRCTLVEILVAPIASALESATWSPISMASGMAEPGTIAVVSHYIRGVSRTKCIPAAFSSDGRLGTRGAIDVPRPTSRNCSHLRGKSAARCSTSRGPLSAAHMSPTGGADENQASIWSTMRESVVIAIAATRSECTARLSWIDGYSRALRSDDAQRGCIV